MAFLEPDYDPAGLNDTGIPVVEPNLPNATTALTRKYAGPTIPALRANYPAPVVNSFIQWELGRARRGVYPTSTKQTLALLKAAQTREAQTAAPERDPWDILGNAASDIGQIVQSLPQLPVQIAHDIQDLPNIQQRIKEGGGGVEGLLSAPGIRLIPGAYTAKNVLTGDFAEIASHPVMSALDVLPYASQLKLGTKLGDVNVGDTTVRALKERAGAALDRTVVGQLRQQTFALSTRGATRTLGENAVEAIRRGNPALASTFNDRLSSIMRDATETSRVYRQAIKDPARDQAIIGGLETGTLDQLDLSDAELAAVNRVRGVQDSYRQFLFDAGELHNVTTSKGVTETYTTPQATRIQRAQSKFARHTTMVELRNAILDPSTTDIADLTDRVRKQLADDAQTVSSRKQVAMGYVHSLDALGYDTGTMLHDIYNLNRSTLPGFTQDPATLQPRGGVLTRRRTGAPPLTSSDSWLRDNRKFTPKSVARMTKALERTEADIVPARWQPLVAQNKQTLIGKAIETRLQPDDPRVPELMRLVHERNYGQVISDGILDAKEVATYEREAVASIERLRAQGIDPEFVHHVTAEQAQSMFHPRLTSVIPQPSQIRARINDWTPTYPNLAVSITHQGLELARREGAQAAVAEIRDAYTVPLGEVRQSLNNTARRIAARNGTEVGAELERLLRREYVRWSETENGFVAGTARAPRFSEFNRLPDDELLLPRHLDSALMQLAHPAVVSRVFDPVLKVFRTAVLPFSVRFQVNNIGGGAIMTALEDPRALMHLPEGFKAAREYRKVITQTARGNPATLSTDVEALINRMPRSMRAQLSSLEYSALEDTAATVPGVTKLFNFKGGQQLGKLFQQAGAGLNRAADWSFKVNQMMDDMYRIAAFREGEIQAGKAGLTGDAAARAAAELVDKIQPRWLEMTPMERSIIRPLVPFYSFLSHVFRYAFRYPIDHPWRTSVMAAFARTELDDFKTGLPQSLARAFFLGSPDTEGNQTIVDIGAMNPFRQLADDLTLAGFLGETNPVFKVALTQLGYDTAARGPNLYPEVEYDAQTGRFKQVPQSTPGLLGNIITNTVPQANIIAALTGTSSEFKAILRTNPDAAKRMLLSQAGIPLLWRNINVPQQIFAAEANRETDARAVLSQAMKTGDYSRARRYPSLAPYITQLQSLAGAGKLTEFQPSTNQDLADAQTQLTQNVSP